MRCIASCSLYQLQRDLLLFVSQRQRNLRSFLILRDIPLNIFYNNLCFGLSIGAIPARSGKYQLYRLFTGTFRRLRQYLYLIILRYDFLGFSVFIIQVIQKVPRTVHMAHSKFTLCHSPDLLWYIRLIYRVTL